MLTARRHEPKPSKAKKPCAMQPSSYDCHTHAANLNTLCIYIGYIVTLLLLLSSS